MSLCRRSTIHVSRFSATQPAILSTHSVTSCILNILIKSVQSTRPHFVSYRIVPPPSLGSLPRRTDARRGSQRIAMSASLFGRDSWHGVSDHRRDRSEAGDIFLLDESLPPCPSAAKPLKRLSATLKAASPRAEAVRWQPDSRRARITGLA